MNDGKRADNENRFSLSPVTVSSSSDQSKHSSVSPPKLSGSLTKSVDGAVRFPLDHRQSHKHPSDLRRPRNMFHTRKYRSRSHSRGKSPPSRYRSRSRSRSLPKRYRSRSRSRGRVSRNRRSRSRSKSFRNRRSRSRSQGRQYRNRRSRSRSSGKAARNRRSRSRSSSYSKSSNRRLVKSRSISREHSRKKYRSRSPSLKSSHRGESVDMRSIWETFQAEVSALESLRVEEERLYDRDPEKHPDYKLEWKKFYKGRVQEILDCGDDPKLHNFESEWAYFWKFRMSDLINMDYEKKKVALKRRLKLPEDAEMPLYLQVKESKNAVLDSGMPPSHANVLPSSKRVGISKGLISTLRIVTAVEEQLGSLGPRVNGLLSEGVSLQRISGSHPDSLLSNPENFVLLETVKEKLLGQIQSNIVKKSLEAAVEEAISSIDVLLKSFAPPNPLLFHNQLYASGERSLWPQGSTNDSQVNVPGVGEVDRVAIAQQIADALIKQGKTDVTEAELQELVNGVVGMVEAQAAQERERQIASQKERLPMQEPLRAEVAIVIPEEKNLVQETPVSTTSLVAPSEIPSIPDPPVLTKNPLPVVKESDALNMLMSVVKSGIKKTNPVEKSLGWSSDDSDEPFTIKPTSLSSQADKNSANVSVKQDIDEKLNVKMEFTRTTETIKNAPSSERQGISTTVAKKETPKWYSQARKSPSPEIFKSMKKKVLLAAAKDRRMALQNKSLSPFSSREETSNPLPNSEEEDEDLKVIGAWDSDSDIDLDSFGKTKGLAYDKINVKRMSPDKYEKNLSLLNKSKEVLQSTVVAAPRSVGPDINLDAAIDNLMGELKNKTSKIEVISSKPQTIVKKPQNISPTKMVGQPSKNGQSISSQTQQMPSNKVVTTQGYHPPYCYPQAQSYGVVQQGYYSNSSVPSFTQSGSGVPYYASNQGATTSAYYNNSGNLVYCPTNAQWQNYYSAQQANIPSNIGSGTNYGKY